jgi:Raf kinase inhibitor-like YbhB/YbcL family protein
MSALRPSIDAESPGLSARRSALGARDSVLGAQYSVLGGFRWHDWLRLLGLGVLAALTVQAAGKEVNLSMAVTSSAFAPNGSIPKQYTCEGNNISPPLQWSGAPVNAKSLVLIVDDPDAPDPAAPRMTWVHWVVYNLPAGGTGLPEAVKSLPAGTLEGLNDWPRTGYGGPCPPVGRHRYFFKLYALDVVLPDLGQPTKQKLEQAMKGHIVEQAQLIGTYQKGR